MSALPKDVMTADQFLDWVVKQHDGRYELFNGIVIKSQSERLVHAELKFELGIALREAIKTAGKPCLVVVDGPLVRVTKKSSFQPDGLVYCGPRHPGDLVEIPNPVIVWEVISPDSNTRDHGEKLVGYFSLPSIQHYLIIEPKAQVLIHHQRAKADVNPPDTWLTRILTGGALTLDPPGLTIEIEQLFEREPDEDAST